MKTPMEALEYIKTLCINNPPPMSEVTRSQILVAVSKGLNCPPDQAPLPAAATVVTAYGALELLRHECEVPGRQYLPVGFVLGAVRGGLADPAMQRGDRRAAPMPPTVWSSGMKPRAVLEQMLRYSSADGQLPASWVADGLHAALADMADLTPVQAAADQLLTFVMALVDICVESGNDQYGAVNGAIALVNEIEPKPATVHELAGLLRELLLTHSSRGLGFTVGEQVEINQLLARVPK